MASLRFPCPRTGRRVDIGIETDPNSLSLIKLFRVRGQCTACGEVHEWQVTDGGYCEPRVACA